MFQLREEDQNALLQIAREAVQLYLSGSRLQFPRMNSTILSQSLGVFVSLHRDKKLRGCIGTIYPAGPLYRNTAECAISAAVNDPRFVPLTRPELDAVTFEISVLSPLERVRQTEEIEVGKHGILIIKHQSRGLLLPQVASDQGWDRERFLSETCRKAGLKPDDWKEGATIQRFTAQVFSEEKIHAA